MNDEPIPTILRYISTAFFTLFFIYPQKEPTNYFQKTQLKTLNNSPIGHITTIV